MVQLLLHMVNEMAIDLTPRWDKFAVYLPAMQYHYASAVDNNKLLKDRDFPKDLKLTDLDFLNPKSKLWHYGYALYSAGQFTDARPTSCSISHRDREKTIVLGDSGGFQIGKGTLRGTEHLKQAKTSAEVCELWRQSGDIRKWIVQWLEAKSDYAMTIDMPLWAKFPSNSKTPFHKCSVQELIDLSIGNLEYIKRNAQGNTKWLNVVQGTNHNDWKLWWNAVKKYKFSGWALAGSVGWRGIKEDKKEGIEGMSGLQSVLQMVLTMRDENAFDKGQDWMHVLGVSQPTWAVILTAIQRGIRQHCENDKFRISYDSASPFQAGGRYQQVVRYPKFTKDTASWAMTMHEAPVNPIYADTGNDYRFPYPSPIGDLLTLNHLNIRGGEFQKGAYDTVSNHLLTNHNVWVYVRSFLEANELAFMHASEADKAVPQKLIDMCAFIEDILGEERWQAKLKKEKLLLAEVFKKSTNDKVGELDDSRETYIEWK
jgi:hypothetical protein